MFYWKQKEMWAGILKIIQEWLNQGQLDFLECICCGRHFNSQSWAVFSSNWLMGRPRSLTSVGSLWRPLMSLSSLVLLAVEQWPLTVGGHMKPAGNDCSWNFWSHQRASTVMNSCKFSWEGMTWHCRWGINGDRDLLCLIKHNNELVNGKVCRPALWWHDNNNKKTKELIVDFRRNADTHPPTHINGAVVECGTSSKFLGIHISQDLTWTTNRSNLVRKAHQCFYFLKTVKKNHLLWILKTSLQMLESIEIPSHSCPCGLLWILNMNGMLECKMWK